MGMTTIHERLWTLRKDRKLTLEQVSEQVGLSKAALCKYESEFCNDISVESLKRLAKFYHVTTDYLLCLSETQSYDNEDFAALGLSDEAIEVLKTQKVSNDFLSEIIAHKDFRKLMADIQLYIQGIASQQIANLNIWIDSARQKVLEETNAAPDDPYMQMMEASRLQEHEVFIHRVHTDLDPMLIELRERHKGKTSGAPEKNGMVETLQTISEVKKLPCDQSEKVLRLFCIHLKICYDKLTEEEKDVLKKFIAKSPQFMKLGSQRGRKKH